VKVDCTVLSNKYEGCDDGKVGTRYPHLSKCGVTLPTLEKVNQPQQWTVKYLAFHNLSRATVINKKVGYLVHSEAYMKSSKLQKDDGPEPSLTHTVSIVSLNCG
jgi:hypothetical protein